MNSSERNEAIRDTAYAVCAELTRRDNNYLWTCTEERSEMLNECLGWLLTNNSDPDRHKEAIELDAGSFGLDGRIKISLHAHRELIAHRWSHSDTEVLTSITVAATKQPALIAKDIVRRLLPSIREYIKTLRDRRDSRNAYVDKTKASVQRIIEAGNGKVVLSSQHCQSGDGGEVSLNYKYDNINDGYINDFRVSGEYCRMHLQSLSIENAVKIIKALTE